MDGFNFYFDRIMLPVAPAQIEIKNGNKIRRVELCDGREIAVAQTKTLAEVKFSALLPQVRYPFATYQEGFVQGGIIFLKLRDLKDSGKPFRFIILRRSFPGYFLASTNIKAVFTELTSRESAQNSSDIIADIKLVEYREGFDEEEYV